MIEVRGVAKYFGRFTALRDLNLTIAAGEFIALFGRNGAGKTTLLRILAGLTRPSVGRIGVQSPGPKSPQHLRSMLGYLAHNTSLYLDLTALENLRFFAHLMDLPASDEDLEEEIARVGLAGRAHEPVRNFSRGMQQRLAIARAFLHDPAILLMDEPFTGLDPEGVSFFKKHLKAAHDRGKTCLMAIHDAPLGYELGDRLIVIEKGVVALDAARTALSLDRFQEAYRALVEAS